MCNYILSNLIKCTKLQWLLKIKDNFYFYLTIISVFLVLFIFEYIRLFQPIETIRSFLILILLFTLSIIGFLYGVGSLMKVSGNINNKVLCIGSFIQIFGFIIIFLIMLIILFF